MTDELEELPPSGTPRAALAPMAAPPKSFYYKPRPAVTVPQGKETYMVDGIQLSPQQIIAVQTIMNSTKRTRILTGRAGAGKSLIIKYLRQRYGLKVCATTGKAAVNIGGTTVHNLFAMRMTDSGPVKCFSYGYLDFCMQKCTQDIVLDEASLCGERMAVYLGEQLDRYDKRMILVGDWAQASPVKDTWMFNTSFWRDADFVKLTESHRQNDAAFIDALDEARQGSMSKATMDLFQSCVDPFPTDTPGIVRMYATNGMTQAWNDQKLQGHLQATGFKPFQLDSLFFDDRDPSKQAASPRNGAFREEAIDNSRLAHQSLFAVGAQVLITKNAQGTYDEETDDVFKEYVNGDAGIIEGILNAAGEPLDPEMSWLNTNIAYVVIRRTRDGIVIRLGRARQASVDAQDKATHYVLGFPLALGWACSIHRSQGMTADRTWLDMRSILSFPKDGRHGLGYVGLSRTRTLQGLKLSEFLPQAVVCDDLVKPWI